MNKLYICMYHYTRDLAHSRYANIRGLDICLFKKQIEFLTNNFNIVTMEQVIDASNRDINLPKNALLLTFDDGYIDNYTYAFPILEEFGIQGSFFIPGKTFVEHRLLDVNKIHYILAVSNIDNLILDLKKELEFYRGTEYEYPSYDELWAQYAKASRFDCAEVIFIKRILQTALPEKLRNIISSNLFNKYVGITEEQLAYELYMTENQIRTMKRHGMYIGLHGYDHYWLSNLNEGQMINDINKALNSLDDFIDRKCWVMNYPYGDYSQQVINYIKSKGAVVGLTTQPRLADLNKDSIYELPRFDCNDFPPKSYKFRNI